MPFLSLEVNAQSVSCTGCGACCEEMGTPPGYAVFFPPEGMAIPDWAEHGLDWPYFEGLPEEARQLLADYYAANDRGEIPDREGLPCLWLDPETRGCRFYRWRPAVCRIFPVGNPGCRSWRRKLGKANCTADLEQLDDELHSYGWMDRPTN